MHLPCLTSPLAARPLIEADMHHAVMSCASTAAFAEEIERLLTDEKHYRELSDAGYQYVHQYYDWGSAVEVLNRLIVNP